MWTHSSRAKAVGISLGAWVLVGCGNDSAEPADKSSAATSPSAEVPAEASQSKTDAPAARKPIDAAQTGSVRGVVTFEGQPPPRTPINVEAAGGCSEHGGGAPLTETVIVNDGKLANVFVRVTKGLAGWTIPPPPAEAAMLDQKGCIYTPHMLGVRVGQKLAVRNSDKATHNVHARPKRPKNQEFNRTQAAGSPPVDAVFGEEEVTIPFACDLHPWMRSWVGVVDHPFFAVSGSDGAFAINGLPAGEYELEAWHEVYGRQTAPLKVAAGAETQAAFQFRKK